MKLNHKLCLFSNLLILSFLFFTINLLGQEVKIDTLRVELSEKITSTNGEAVNYYPMIRTGNKEIDSLINYDLKNKVLYNSYPEENFESAINNWAEEGLVLLDFTINYNKSGILSLNIDQEGCGAYCTFRRDYYNYSTKTGKALELSDIVNLPYLKEDIIKKKNEQYKLNREILKEWLEEDEGLDLKTYNWALKKYNECDNSFEIDEFALFENQLKIVEKCHLPHAFKPLIPIIDIQYELSDIKDYLKIKIK